MNKQSLKAALVILLALGTMSSTARAGSESHGGIGIVSAGKLYLLDLVEAGIERNTNINRGDGTLPLRPSVPNDEGIGWGGDRVHEITLVTENGRRRRQILDGQWMPVLRAFLAKSTPENGFLFGQELRDVCDNCFSEATTLAIALTNRMVESGYPRTELTESAIMRAFRAMRWILVRAPLRLSRDENSALADRDKVMVASRDGNTVRISEPGWSHPFRHEGHEVRPLDDANQAALITHEVLFYMTAHQGDTDSDRARRANARLWERYHSAQDPFRPTFWDELQRVPGRPSSNPRYVHELRPGSELVMARDYTFPFATSPLVLVGGHDPMEHADHGHRFYGTGEGHANVNKRHDRFTGGRISWQQNDRLRRGDRYVVKRVYVSTATHEMITTIEIDNRWGGDILSLDVYTPRRGTPALLADFEAMVDKFFTVHPAR